MTSDRVKPAFEGLIDSQVENARQERLLFNPDAAVNSLLERVLDLRNHGVAEDRVRMIAAELRDVLLSNARERDGERTATGVLDELLREFHQRGFRSQIRVRALAQVIRPLIRAELDGVQPHAMLARRDLLRLAEQYGTAKLLCAGIRGQLTHRQYARLTEIVGEGRS